MSPEWIAAVRDKLVPAAPRSACLWREWAEAGRSMDMRRIQEEFYAFALERCPSAAKETTRNVCRAILEVQQTRLIAREQQSQ